MQGRSRAEQAQQLAWVLDLVRLKGLEERYPNELSGGQKQRVALARGLISRPLGAAPRRAARQSRPRAAPRDGGGGPALPEGTRHPVRLRHAQSGGGADPVRPHRGHARGLVRAGRPQARDLSPAGDPVRRGVRRRAEPPGARIAEATAAPTRASIGTASTCSAARSEAARSAMRSTLFLKPERIRITAAGSEIGEARSTGSRACCAT